MAIPFFSIDLDNKDIIKTIYNFFIPLNYKKSEDEIILNLKKRFKNKHLNILPSARLGFYLTLRKNFKMGDEIIFSAMSFPLYIKIANELGLKVKLVDVENDTMNIDINTLKKTITKNTKCIIVTHLFGYPCKIDEIKEIANENNIFLIEDCAQSFDTYYKNIETGMYGNVGIFSCSLIKIPTTLSGGILISDDRNLYDYIENWKLNNLDNSMKKKVFLFLKNFISILNSFPFLYSILTSKIFSFLDKFNPRIYRKIVYSGMGINKNKFDPYERSNLSKYQLEFGLGQIKKLEIMKKKRKENTEYIKKYIKNLNNIEFLNYDESINWNYQYFVIKVKKNFKKFNKLLFQYGIHSMEENVWNCLEYNYKIENNDNGNFIVTNRNNPRLLRIQNSSYLKKKHLDKIIDGIKKANENSS